MPSTPVTILFQANVNHSPTAQDLCLQAMAEWQANLAVISEPYYVPPCGNWVGDLDDVVAVVARAGSGTPLTCLERGKGYAVAESGSIVVIGVYFSRSRPLAEFELHLDAIRAAIDRLSPKTIFVMGDFNAKHCSWGNTFTEPRGRTVEEWALQSGLTILNQGSVQTCVRARGGSVIDLSFATHAAARRVVGWRVLEEVESLSDHRYIRFELTPSSGPSPVHRPPLFPRWALTKLDPEQAEEWALTESWAYPVEFENLESQAEHMRKTLTRVCDAAMPRVSKRQPPCKQVHWWTEELGEMRKAVRIISHRLKRCRARRPPDYVAENGLVGEFREARKALSIAILQAKARARAELLETLDRDPWGRPYRGARNTLRPCTSTVTETLEPEVLRSVIDGLFPDPGNFTPPSMGPPVPDTPTDEEPHSISEGELDVALDRLRGRKTAPGPDGVPGRLLFLAAKHLRGQLRELFEACIRAGRLPSQWKEGRLCLIPKGGRPPNDPSAFRPIVLLNEVAKVFEKILAERLVKHLDTVEPGLSETQFGFRRRRSTMDAFETLRTSTDEAVQAKDVVLAVSLDIANAFNSLPHETIREGLRAHGVPPYLTRLLGAYLQDRHILWEGGESGNPEQKVLQQTEVSVSASTTQPTDIASVGNTVKPTINQTSSKVTYKPTPISELNKINNTDIENNEEVNEQKRRHIPVPYTPRKPVSVPISRPAVTNGSSKPFIYIPPPVKYTPGSNENIQCDKYTPPGAVESKEKYLPGAEVERQEYKPNEGSETSSTKRNYIPSDVGVTKKKILEYKPTKVTKAEVSSVTYKPTPKALAPCFSSDEDEPETKKSKLSNDLNGLDDLGPEFDILDQILDEEKTGIDKNKTENKTNLSTSSKTKLSTSSKTKLDKCDKDSSKNSKNETQHKKSTVNKTDYKSEKIKSHKKEKASTEEMEKTKHKNKHSDNKSSHKSSSEDKDRREKRKKEKDKEKHSDKKRHSKTSSRSSDHKSKDSKHSSSRKSDSHSDSKSKYKNSHKSPKDSKEKSKDISSKNLSDHDDCNNDNHIINEEVYISESDEETIALECRKIFEEYVPLEKNKIAEYQNKIEEVQEDEYIPGKKRISRTVDKNIKITPRAPIKPDFKVNAAQTMAERLAKVREYHMSKNSLPTLSTNNDITINKPEMPKSTYGTPISGNTKIRIAHVPYVSTMINAKKSILPSHSETKSEPSTSSTIVQTIKKGAQRVAHVPSEKFIDRPGVLEPLASKIPANIRSTYLNMMIDECLKIYITATDAYARAQQEELATSKKCSTVQIYKNSAGLTVNRLRKELQECNGIKKSASDLPSVQKTTDSKSINCGSWSIESKNRKVIDHSKELCGAKLYNNIQKWVLTEEQLKENGFPRSHPGRETGRAIIYGQNKQKPPIGFIRTCCRCKKDYTVNKKGFAAINEECIYHPNNKYRVRGEVRYQCCSQDSTSDGCCIAPSHVYEYVDFDNLKGFVKTLPPERNMEDYGVYSLDCEMCYTTHGLDLTRVTVINSACKIVYETLIKPLHPIIDYNTRYSGITEEQMSNVKTTLIEVQATLLSMFNSKTILIGHSLESDFKALKLIHDTVVDTSVLFPHKMGPPYKRALRNLSSEHLKKIIQNSVDGHDSAEDATVCMELIHYKIKEELKTR
ncbi:hypothetical protein K1T71_012235 [Dendrolimus kikuchii]|uniref:Uncharacterized protein n=1 Tax=Dendrolimus kikuchii TaxID=765133 RepID=A0ACC1CL12_9NEOP|nr:hypothetical protein K1T71_012235 [Dendrolimus kikuchii]